MHQREYQIAVKMSLYDFDQIALIGIQSQAQGTYSNCAPFHTSIGPVLLEETAGQVVQ